jgi:hypothetical protein
VTATLLCLYFVVQILLPLRHFLYPGEVSWTEEGHRFAWHMMLRSKTVQAKFTAHDPQTGRTWGINAREYVKGWQFRSMRSRPDMILQFSHYVADQLRKRGHEHVQIRASVTASLNGRPPQLLVDPTVDLAAQPRTLRPARWILPLAHEAPATAVDPVRVESEPPR